MSPPSLFADLASLSITQPSNGRESLPAVSTVCCRPAVQISATDGPSPAAKFQMRTPEEASAAAAPAAAGALGSSGSSAMGARAGG
jgi:hypothetical protein